MIREASYLHILGDNKFEYRPEPDFNAPMVVNLAQPHGRAEKGDAISLDLSLYNTVQGRGIQWVPEAVPSFNSINEACNKLYAPGPIILTNPKFSIEQLAIASLLDLRLHQFELPELCNEEEALDAVRPDAGILNEIRRELQECRPIFQYFSLDHRNEEIRGVVKDTQRRLLGEVGYQDYLRHCQRLAQ